MEPGGLVPLSRPTRKPDWIRSRLPSGAVYESVRGVVRDLALETVCEHSRCPNVARCWGEGTATIMVMGDRCTRGCRFCHVGKARAPLPLDDDEPRRLGEAVRRLRLGYVVITSVDRDDLDDAGASHLAACVRAIRRSAPAARVELLMPDLGGEPARVREVVESGPDVVAHNLETVERLTPRVRDRRASYRTSLRVLDEVRRARPGIVTKSGMMLGLGEELSEVRASFRDLLGAGVRLLTVGQYLQPSPRHLPVERYVPPDAFADLEQEALALGFMGVAAGPLTRSSFRARELYEAARAPVGARRP